MVLRGLATNIGVRGQEVAEIQVSLVRLQLVHRNRFRHTPANQLYRRSNHDGSIWRVLVICLLFTSDDNLRVGLCHKTVLSSHVGVAHAIVRSLRLLLNRSGMINTTRRRRLMNICILVVIRWFRIIVIIVLIHRSCLPFPTNFRSTFSKSLASFLTRPIVPNINPEYLTLRGILNATEETPALFSDLFDNYRRDGWLVTFLGFQVLGLILFDKGSKSPISRMRVRGSTSPRKNITRFDR